MFETDLIPSSLNLPFVEGLYAEFLRDPASVEPDWRRYFEQVRRTSPDGGIPQEGPTFRPRSLFNPATNGHTGTNGANGANGVKRTADLDIAARQDRVDQMIRNYRVRGHRIAHIDPLGRPTPELPELSPAYFGFTEADLDRPFSTATIDGANIRTLRKIVKRMQSTYCRFIGVQFMHIDDTDVREWLQERMEGTENRIQLSRDEQIRIFTRLTDAVMFEEFIQKKFLGAKSFSLEGAESLIPLLELAIEKAGDQGIQEIVLGMAHRGRLNVLANILGKSAQQIFREFEDVDPHLHRGRGDVKYHLGHSSDWNTASGKKVHLSLCFNPSHLEFVNPVALGRTRAKQDRQKDYGRKHGLTILIHGDAAFAGEGVVQETLNMSQLGAYATGGTLHVIVNNQIGFTTCPDEGRSSPYATDVAKMLQIPIFHVNGEHPDSVAQVIRLAMDFREKFQRDVVIDMYCYRLRGHNEGDEPAFTQPLMYAAIAHHDSVRDSYLDHLLTLGGITLDEANRIAEQRREHLEKELSIARGNEYKHRQDTLSGVWRKYRGGRDREVPDVGTGVSHARLVELLELQTRLPDDFHPHPKVKRLVQTRSDMAAGKAPLDWATAESLAFASLVTEGTPIRMSGQDVGRGTFSQRHAVLHDVQDGHRHIPIQHLAPDQAPFEIYNSPLAETGVLGFEYGYSLDRPEGLILWEAQFGDFVNAAQVIIDQFIVSAEDKWRRLSGVVMLLPHGLEGQGPEHSSGRLERFLTLAAEDNIQVVNASTPAQYFHLLRRQVLRPIRKPLVVMTPKSLLRNPLAVSPLDELTTGTFQRIIPDSAAAARKKIKRVLLCSGKFYYELAARREELKRQDVAILRVEQLYPLEPEALEAALAPFSAGTPVFWVQEEPENMGAWRYLWAVGGSKLCGKYPFQGVYRPASASPASGSSSSHKLEQQQLLEEAFAGL